MSAFDGIIVAAYLAVVLVVGARFARQGSLREFFLGNRDVPWWAAMFSGIATIVSGVSYLGAPGLAFSSNYTFHQIRLGMPLALLVLGGVMLPILFRLNIYSIYEYLERRFDRRTRRLASSLFLLLKCGYLAVVIYAPSLVLAEITGWPVLSLILLTGLTTTLYTVCGGIRAVIWTDTLQLFVLLGGLAAAIAIVVNGVDGGLARIWEVADAAGRLELWDPSLDFTTTYTVLGGIFGGAFMLLSQWGSDQAEIQRFMTTKSVAHANRALILSMLVSAGVGLGLFFVGTALFSFYSVHPEKGGLLTEPNRIFVKFITEEMPVGARGLLVAAVLAASMSTISAVLNSQAAVLLSDFFTPWKKRAASLAEARWTTLGLGVLVTAVACGSGRLGNLLEATTRIINLFGGSLTAVFLLGMVTARVTARGAFWGTLSGIASAVAVNFLTPISFLWLGPISASVVTTVAFAVSRLDHGGEARDHTGLVAFGKRR